MGHTAVPDAIAGLLATLKGYSGLSGISVFDGQLTGSYEPEELICVCFDDEGSPVSGAQSPAELGALRRQESFTIRNIVSVAAGDDDVATSRARVFTLFGSVEDALRATPQFAGVNTYGDIREYSYSQDQTDSGIVCTIAFWVHCMPYARRF